jgi:hypothetical protein
VQGQSLAGLFLEAVLSVSVVEPRSRCATLQIPCRSAPSAESPDNLPPQLSAGAECAQ